MRPQTNSPHNSLKTEDKHESRTRNVTHSQTNKQTNKQTHPILAQAAKVFQKGYLPFSSRESSRPVSSRVPEVLASTECSKRRGDGRGADSCTAGGVPLHRTLGGRRLTTAAVCGSSEHVVRRPVLRISCYRSCKPP